MIKIKGLKKTYNKGKRNELEVLNDITLELPSHSLVTILGESGSGKTTLLNCIAGLDKAFGEISYDDFSMKNYHMNQIDKFRSIHIGYIFQNYNLIQNETVYDNLMLALNLIGNFKEEDIANRINYCLEVVGMDKYKNRLAGALSGGQQQRVSIARALIKDAPYIIADEPTGNLDSENSIEIMNVLRKISKTRLVLLVTHNKRLAYFFSDRIIHYKDGKVIEDLVNEPFSSELMDQKNSTIYLKDYDLVSSKIENLNVSLYTDHSLDEGTIKIIIKNGNIYFESQNKAYSTNEKKILLLDEHKKMLDKSQIENFKFDMSNIISSKKESGFKLFLNRLKENLISFFNSNVKSKISYFCFGLLALLFAFSAFLLANYQTSNQYDGVVPENSLTIKSDEKVDLLTFQNLVTDSNVYNYGYVSKSDNKASEYISFYINGSVGTLGTNFESTYTSLKNQGKILYGREISKVDEVVFSKGLIDSIIDEIDYSALSYLNFINHEISLNGFTFKIVGISDNLVSNIYMRHDLAYRFSHSQYFPSSIILGMDEIDYTLLHGSNPKAEDEVLLPVSEYSKYRIGDKVLYKNQEVYVSGFFEVDTLGVRMISYKTPERSKEEITKENFLYNSMPYSLIDEYNIKLVEGSYKPDFKEVIISNLLGYDIGDKIYLCGSYYKIVGLYESSPYERDMVIVSDLERANSMYYAGSFNNLYIETKNKEEFINQYSSDNFSIVDAKEQFRVTSILETKNSHTFIIIFSISLFSLSVIFSYFLMRSRMLSNIYDIGVYRALGALKSRIYEKYLEQIAFITVFISSVVYIITSILITIVVNSKVINLDLRNGSIYFLYGYLVMILVEFLFGMLPIIRLLKKTPAEILAKYDI